MNKVIAFGSFDPLHKGHIYYLKQAKKLGDELIVIVTSDKKIEAIKHRRPKQNQKQRLRKLRGLQLADKIVLGESAGKYKLIDKIKPDIIALGYDQKIPVPLKNEIKKYKIVRLKPFKPEVYKSSLL